MRLRYSRLAFRQIREISSYLERRSPSAARQVGGQIRDAVHMLLEFPELGHDGAAATTCEFVVPGARYIIVYRLYRRAGRDGELRIAGIYLGAQLRPGQRRLPDEGAV
jgi:plasmid stabilization system protein ParE